MEIDMDAWLAGPRTMVRVYKLPQQLSNGFCFGGGIPITFLNVDWFEALVPAGTAPLREFIRRKNYFDPHARYLALSDDPSLTFTIFPEHEPAEQG